MFGFKAKIIDNKITVLWKFQNQTIYIIKGTMNILQVKPKAECRWDSVSLGEILLRFDPGDDRIHTARSFEVFDGGGEYNVAKNLARCFRQRTAVITALADNGIGRLAEDFARQGGVDTSEIVWREDDGIGSLTRNGLYFIERGSGLRPPNSTFDRGNTAVSQLKAGDVDWQKIFGEKGSRWFHTGGIFAGLSETTPAVALEAIKAAGENGAAISYDLNYRASLWKKRGGLEAANRLNRKILPFADVIFGVFDFNSSLAGYDEEQFCRAAEKLCAEFPNVKVVASTLRDVRNASRHDLSAVCYGRGESFKSKDYLDAQVLDRVGSGDGFAAGFVYGLLENKGLQYAVECGAAHAVLLMTTVGDNSLATLEEVESLMNDESLNAKR